MDVVSLGFPRSDPDDDHHADDDSFGPDSLEIPDADGVRPMMATGPA